MELYVMGGGYRDNTKPEPTYRHRAVSPGTPGSRPYVFTNPNGSSVNVCKHHSHLYRLSDDRQTATLVRHSAEATGVLAPQTLTLDHDQIQGVMQRINGQGTDGVTAG